MPRHESADFDDDRANLNKDAHVRRRYLTWFNKRREDFDSDQAYDDYLEMVEDIIHNIVHNIDVDATKARVDKYRAQNQHLIGSNQAKRAEEERATAERIALSERRRLAQLADLRRKDAVDEEERKRKRRQQHAEELLRISKGDEALAKLKQKRERAERKRRKRDAAAAREAEERARQDEMAARVGPCFPHPPPGVVGGGAGVVSNDMRPVEVAGAADADRAAKAAVAAGFRQRYVYQRAMSEFRDSLAFILQTRS